MAMKLIQSLNGTGSSGTIAFTSIPQTYSHLYVVGCVMTANAVGVQSVWVRLNGTTDTDHQGAEINAIYTTTAGGTTVAGIRLAAPGFNNGFASQYKQSFDLLIIDYTSTTTRTGVLTKMSSPSNNIGTSGMAMVGGNYNKNDAITSLRFMNDSGNFLANTEFSLYGID